MDPELGAVGVCLPAPSLAGAASLEFDAEQPDPEAARALGVVGWELEQGQWWARHRVDDNAAIQRAAPRGSLLRD